MVGSNYKFIEQHHPLLSELGANAEAYAYSDPQSAVVKLRCFAELFVGFVYEELSLSTYGASNFFEKLENAAFIDAVEKDVVDKLHFIRRKGNKAAHPGGVSIQDVLDLLKEAYFLSAWLYIAYHDGQADQLPDYHQPQPQDAEDEALLKDKRRLEEVIDLQTDDLARAKAQLIRAEQQQLEAMRKIDALKGGRERAIATYNFEPGVTRAKVEIEDIFAEYQLTNGQQELVSQLDEFLSNATDNVFLMKGYAGTGKTFITKGLTEYFRAIGRNYVLAAPTGKASKVIAKKAQSPAHTIHKTIYSFKDIAEYREDDVDGSETYKFYAQLAVNELSVDTVYVIDESSMISDIYNEAEFFRFGSGYLLRDFLKFVNLDHNDHRKKVIFIGDDAQLSPVGMKFSPALDPDYLSKEYGQAVTGYKLTEVVRQKADSGVMHNAVEMRQALKENIFNQLDIKLGFPDVAHVDYEDLIARYLETCDGKINAESIVIAHSNADVAAYNKRIREEFFPDQAEICSGDKVMAVTNSDAHGFFISNGDFGLIRKVFGEAENKAITIRRKSQETGEVEEIVVPLQFRHVEAGFRDLKDHVHFFEVKIVENLLYPDAPTLSSDENKALYVDFCIRNKHLKPGSLEFKATLRSDPYFNALRLKFGYAITCHKAQGSEWNHVFVKCKFHQSQLCAEYFRWLYTAITRTSSNLYLLDEPHIRLGDGIKVISNPGTLQTDSKRGNQKSSANVIAPSPMLSAANESAGITNSTEGTFRIPEENSFLLLLLSHVRGFIDSSDTRIDDILHQQYQEAYFFTQGTNSARINLSYDRKQKITSITNPLGSELGGQLLTLLAPLKSKVVIESTCASGGKEFQFDEQFLNDFHERISPIFADHGIDISDVQEQQWCQRYWFVKADDTAVLDIYYNKKKKFTNCDSVKNLCTSKALVKEVSSIVTSGLS